MMSEFLIRHRGIGQGAMAKWSASNPGWADQLKSALRYPDRFSQIVEALAQAIKRSQAMQ